MLISLVLTFANCASWDPRTKHLIDSVSIRFGLIVAGINFAAVSKYISNHFFDSTIRILGVVYRCKYESGQEFWASSLE